MSTVLTAIKPPVLFQPNFLSTIDDSVWFKKSQQLKLSMRYYLDIDNMLSAKSTASPYKTARSSARGPSSVRNRAIAKPHPAPQF
jgi:hypothetical protein